MVTVRVVPRIIRKKGEVLKEAKQARPPKRVVNGKVAKITTTTPIKKQTSTANEEHQDEGSRRSTRDRKSFVPFSAATETPRVRTMRTGPMVKSRKRPAPEETTKKTKKGGREKKQQDKKSRLVREIKSKVSKKGNDRLQPRPNIVVPKQHPLIFGKTDYVSWRSLSRKLLSAVLKQDIKEIGKAFEDQRIQPQCSQHHYSNLDRRCALVEAIASGNDKLLQTLLKKQRESNERGPDKIAPTEPNLLERKSTGRSNFMMIGRATRAIEAARGGKEGNNAFLNYEPGEIRDVLSPLIERAVPYTTLTAVADSNDTPIPRQRLQSSIVEAMRWGHRQLAGHLAQEATHFFNVLQLECLKDKGALPKQVLAISVRKKSYMNKNITPAHTAAVNSDASFLDRLREVDPLINVPDQNGWHTTHYAAVCEGTAPLKLLIQQNIPIMDVTKKGELPLHVAARAGRAENVKILLDTVSKLEKHQKSDEEEEDVGDEEEGGPRRKRAKVQAKGAGPKSLANAKTRQGRTALHYAAYHGRTDVVKALLAVPVVDKECTLSANDKKLTPLMIAAGAGHLDTCTALIDAGCLVEAKDKLKRSPLMIAVINGQSHIVALLLQKGADIKRADSSGNTAMHYACAYGWLDIVKQLVEIDPTTLAAANDWLITPLSVAYLKGHYGIVSWLLESPAAKDHIDINSKDNNGVTLISSLIAFHDENSTAALPDQIDYLIKNGTECSIKDTAGNNPLHIFAAVPILLKVEKPTREAPGNDKRITSKQYKKCMEQLQAAGADGSEKNTDGATPFKIALDNGNLYLASLLLDQMSSAVIEDSLTEEGNILHALFKLPFTVADKQQMWAYSDAPLGGQYNIVPMLTKIAAKVGDAKVAEWMGSPDKQGSTPILQMCTDYSSLSRGSMEASQFAAYANTMMATLRECFRIRPEGVMDRKIVKGEEKEKLNENQLAELPCVIYCALNNSSAKHGKNNLIQTILDCAMGAGLLEQLLSIELYEPKVQTRVVPLLVALMDNTKENEAIAILDIATVGDIKEKVHGATIKTRMVNDTQKDMAAVPVGSSSTSNTPVATAKASTSRQMNGFGQNKFFGGNRARGAFGFPQSNQQQKATPNGKEMIEVPWEKSAFHVAVDNCMLNALEHLVLTPQQSAAADADGNTAWHYAAAHLKPETLQLFERLQNASVPISKNNLGMTPLHVAVNAEKTGSADAFLDPIEWLLERSPSDGKDTDGRTALHYAFEKLDEKKKKETTKQDPIALASLLLGKLDKNTIRAADVSGNTALHLAAKADANICSVSLLAKGAEVDARNNDGNTALALALLHKSQAVALTLIQARAAIGDTVMGPVPEAVKQELWTLASDPVDMTVRFQSSISALVVRNEWHALVFVILDLLGKTPDTVGKLVAAALQNGQHNFAIYLLKLFGNRGAEAVKKWDFLMMYVESLKVPVAGPALTVLNMLFDLGFNYMDKEGKSKVVEKAAENGHYGLLQIIKDRDVIKFAKLVPSDDGYSPIRSLVERWIRHPKESERIKEWLILFSSMPGLSLKTKIAVPRAAMPGFPETFSPPDIVMVTPLERAVQAHHHQLVQFLVLQGVPVNGEGSEVPPLLLAVATNKREVIKAMVDGEQEDDINVKAPVQNGNAKQKVMLFGGNSTFQLGRKCITGKCVPASDDEDDDEDGSEYESSPASPEDGDDEVEEEEEVQPKEKKKTKPLQLIFKTKGLKVDSRDSRGRNLLHWMVEPCGWQNIELFTALNKAKGGEIASLCSSPDKDGVTPIELAARLNQGEILAKMSKFVSKALGNVSLKGIEVTVPAPPFYDVTWDAAELEKKFPDVVANNKKKKEKKNPRTPNSKTGYEETGEIVECTETQQLYKVLLNKTDMRAGLFGFHNYYRMELVKRKDTELYVLFTNWGRIGDPHGEYQCTPFTLRAAAEKEFRSVFKQKTGQEWTNLANFDDKPGKYRLTTTEVGVESAADLNVEEFVLKKEDEGDKVMCLIADIANVKMLKDYAHDVRLYNQSRARCPFGKIAKEDIDKAWKILERVKKNLAEVEKERTQRPPNAEKLLRLTNEQYQLTSEFYTTVPLGGFESCAMQVISNGNELVQAENVLHALSDIEISGRLVSAASYAKLARKEDPLIYILSVLSCPITALSPMDDFSQLVLKWIRRSTKGMKVRGLFSINPRKCAEAFQKHANDSGIMHLVHGTKAQNLLPILESGLKATPANALQCGQAFGKGVYFADTIEKSRAYCQPSNDGNNYMLICKVALGKIYDKPHLNDKPEKFDTRKVTATQIPDPQGAMVVEGATLPIGELITKPPEPGYYGWGGYNEYVVCDEARILPTHLLVFK